MLGNLNPLLRQLRAANAMLAEITRRRGLPPDSEKGTFAAFFKKRDEAQSANAGATLLDQGAPDERAEGLS